LGEREVMMSQRHPPIEIKDPITSGALEGFGGGFLGGSWITLLRGGFFLKNIGTTVE
jgi:hypothetical protein